LKVESKGGISKRSYSLRALAEQDPATPYQPVFDLVTGRPENVGTADLGFDTAGNSAFSHDVGRGIVTE
jgi:hypothetical protein